MKKKLHLFLASLCLIGGYLNAQQKTQLPIKGSYNDVAITTSSNAVNYTSTGLYLEGGTTAAPTETYIRFQEISLPADAVIKSANIIFYGRTASTVGTTVTIFGERGNSDAYPTSTAPTTATSIKGRQYTFDSVTWNTPVCVANKEYTTPDVTNLLQDMFPAGVGNANISFKLAGNQKGSFVMWSFDGNAAMAPKLQITFTSAYGTFTTTVLANTDDGRENTNGSMYLTDGYINLGGRSDSSNSVVRFPVVEIPEKAEISEAYIEFYSYGTSPASTVNIYTELADAATYATTSGNITKRNYSVNTVNWFTESWTISNTQHKTPDLKNIIDATRLSGWQSGQAIGFKFVGTLQNNGATASTNEMGELYKPRLVIKYKTEGNGPKIETNPLNGVSASVISTGNDDAREYTNGNMALGDGYMHLSRRTDGSDSGFIFRNTQIPANAEIKDAYIEFYAYATSPATTVNIYAEKSKNLPYTNNPKSITAREYTNNNIQWATEAWTSDLAKNRTPNLRNVIDEIRLNGWKSGENIAFKFNGTGLNDGARAYAYEGSTLYRPRLVVEYVNNGAGPSIVVDPNEIQTSASIVSTGNDDGREYTNGNMALGDGAIFLSGRTDGSDSGFTFRNTQIPATAEIKEAYIEFYAYATSPATTVNIYAEKNQKSPYSYNPKSITAREYTTNNIHWATEAWTTDLAKKRTPDLRNIIDEIRLSGWKSGENIAFKFNGQALNDGARAYAYEGSTLYRPRLVVKYVNNGAGPSIVVDPNEVQTYVSIINTGNDDGREYTNGNMALGDGAMFLSGRTDGSDSGFIFRNTQIPANAEIKDAYIEFYAYATSPATTVNIYAEKSKNLPYTNNPKSITAREYTNNNIQWATEAWTSDLAKNRTPNLRNVIDEIRLNGWKSGENIAFKFNGQALNDGARAYAYEGSTLYRPRLVVKYVNNGAGPSIVVDPNEVQTYVSIINTGNDDGREYTNGNMALGDGAMFLSGRIDGSDSGFTFRNAQVPANAEIKDAYIEFYAYATSPATTVDIYAEMNQKSPYAYTPKNITAREYSNNKIHWVTENWTTDLAKNRTPNLRNIIDEIRLNGWKSGENIAFKINGIGLNDGARAYAYEGSSFYRPRLVIKYVLNGAGPSIVIDPNEIQTEASIVSTGNDDGREFTNGNMALGDGYMFLSGRTDGSDSGYIFRNAQIPANSEIKDAYIEFYAYATSPATTVDIYAEVNQKTPYTYDPKSITARQYSNNKINWVTEAWNTDLAKNRTPNLRNIIDEIRLNGWKSGENIAFKFNGLGINDGARAYAYEGSVLYKPRLVIKYVLNGAGPSIVVDPNEIQTSVSIVTNGYDDGRENTDGNIYLGDAYLSLAGQSDSYKTGIRFQAVEFPTNAEITEAYIEFYAYGSSNATTVSIKSEIGDAQIYSPVKNNISSRTYTENTELWNTDTRNDYAQNRTVDIKKLIDENRLRGWESGQGLAFLFEGKGVSSNFARVRAYEAGNMYRPRLVIKYKDNQKGPNAASVISTLNNVITTPSQMTGLVINEVSAQGTTDQKEDWIEIYNSLDKMVLIDSNVSVSNKDTKKDLNILKNILVPAKGFAALIADKKPEKGDFHLNFDLKNTGGTLYLSTLVGKKTTALDELKYLETPYNTSYGRSTDASTTLAAFINPTYNLSNSVGQQGLALSFSKERGVYPTGFDVTITAPAGTTINYTLDGKFPSKTVGTKYTVPVSIKQSCVLKVYAYDATGNSGVASHTYVLQDNYKNELPTSYAQWYNKTYILTADEYSKAIAELPIISISTDAEISTLWVQGSFEYIDKHIYSDHTNFFSNSTTKQFGQASLAQYNGGVKFKFNKNAAVKKANYPFFDTYPGEVYPTTNKIQVISLKEGQDGPQNNIYNTGYLRFDEKMTMNLSKEIGKYALDTRYVNFFINGKYRGVKTMRNDFSSNNLEEVFGDDADNYTTVNLQDGNFPGGVVEEGDGSTAIWQNIKKLAAAKDFQGFKNWVDVEDLIKFQIMFMFTDTENEAIAIVHNYAPTFMKAKMNINDTDGAFFGGFTAPTSSTTMPAIGFAGGGGNYKQKWILNDSRLGPGGLFGNFMGSNTNQTTGNLEFKTLVKDYVQAAFGDSKSTVAAPLSVSNVQTKIKTTVTELNNVYKLDAAYMSYDREVYNYWKNIDVPRVIAQVPERVSYSLQKWQEYNMVHTMLAAPFDTTVTGHITINNPNTGTQVYYTTDGSDPMGKDGVVSPSAFLYDANKGITLSSGIYSLVSRAFTTNNWGPLSKADVKGSVMTKRSAANISEELLNTEAQHVIIYPNPAYNEINVNLENTASVNSTMSIYSIDGKLVQNNTLTSQSNTVNIGNLNSGFYIIKIVNGNGTVSTHKLIKK
ncbi:FN3 associated domain-containing protein [Flavobacterium sp. PS2]|uniref:FN3 associated domain-containing protein n=1 Tax=Flavobacterium sp. PS2 TaxID=3384157 RepID=UPI00390CD7F8